MGVKDKNEKNLVVAKNIHKVYKMGKISIKALGGVNLQIKRGEMVAVMGPSGCGKTTLLNCLSGLDDVTEGEVWINGNSMNNMNDDLKSEFRAKNMGFIFQFYNLLPVLTAFENVEIALRIAGVSPDKAHDRAKELLALVGLSDRCEHKPAELSGGQRQRVTIARALANDPLIVWADEPTGDLDRTSSDEILKLLERLCSELGKTVIMVTHDPAAAERASVVHRLDKGALE